MANVNDSEVFIPTTHGNDKAEKPITFHIRFLTAAEQAEVEYMELVPVGNRSTPRINVKTNHNYLFERGVEKIDNCKYGETAEAFMRARGPSWLGEMIKEVALHIKQAMEIDEKN